MPPPSSFVGSLGPSAQVAVQTLHAAHQNRLSISNVNTLLNAMRQDGGGGAGGGPGGDAAMGGAA